MPVSDVAISLLGPVQLISLAGPVRIGGAKPRAVLAALALRQGRVVGVDQLIDDLWADRMPATARNTVQVYVSAVRRALDDAASPVRLESRPAGYLLTGSKEHVDWHLFESFAAQGRARQALHDDVAARQLLTRALALWNGTPVADIGDVPLAVAVRAQAQAAWLAVLGDRIEADLACDPSGLVAELVGLNHEHPLNERFTGQLMRALDWSGRRAEARAHYHRFRAQLVEETGLEPGPQLRQLYQRLLAEEEPEHPTREVVTGPGAPAPLRRTGPRAPAERDLIGRDRDLDLLRQLTADQRVVSVVGPPGVGKSALAEQLATRLADPRSADPRSADPRSADPRSADPPGARAPRAVDDVWFLQVEAVGEPSRLVAALLAQVGGGQQSGDVDELAQLRLLLLGRSVTLLLDNTDHLTAGCVELIAALTPERPDLHVVLTARRPCGLPGEVVYRLDPLQVPGDPGTDVLSLGEVASVALFVARARQTTPRLEFGPGNAGLVATACRLLDGLPLAIELAAARLRMMSLAELTERLHTRLDTLDPAERSPERHAPGSSLRASLQLSWSSLDEQGRQALGALSFWVGGFTSAAAEALLEGTQLHPLDVLQDLVDRSLVLADIEIEETRYRLLNTVRQFVQEQLPADRAHRAQQRQAVHLRDLTARAAEERRGDQRLTWLNRLNDERPAIEATLSWAIDHRPDLALELLASLWWWWCDRPAEGLFWYRRALSDGAADGAADGPASAARLQALLGAAVVVSFVRPLEALGHAEAAHRLATAIGSPLERIRAQQHLADISYELGDLAAAREHGDAALALAISSGVPYAQGRCLLTVAYNHLGAFDLDRARARAMEALACFRGCDDPAGVADAQLVVTEAETLAARHSGRDRTPPAGALTAARTVAAFRREHSPGQLARALVQRAWCSDEVDDPGGQQRVHWLHEAFSLHARVAHRWSIARDLDLVAELCVGAGDHLKATILLAASETVRTEMDAGLLPRDLVLRQPLVEECTRRLGASAYRVAAALGAACDLAAAVAEVLALSPEQVRAPSRV